MFNACLLLAEAVVYFLVMSTLFRLRRVLGTGVFFSALGTLHFLETYLAGVFYVEVGSIALSPGSTVLFSGKLLMLLLVYLREDAVVVRQPIYGLFAGNLVVVGLVSLLRLHSLEAVTDGHTVDITFIDEMGWLMVWGTLLLFLDSIFIILLYERVRRWIRRSELARVFLCAVIILTFDQFGFYTALHYVVDAPASVLVGGWIGKMAAAAVFSLLVVAYLRWGETAHDEPTRLPKIGDVLDTLTYRERYERLLNRAGRDGLTGLLDRGTLETEGAAIIAEALRAGEPVSLVVFDIDHFKPINDRYGHAAGDAVLRRVAVLMNGALREGDRAFRYGGEEFVIVCRTMGADAARDLAERIRRAVGEARIDGIGEGIGMSAGISAAPLDGGDYAALFKAADRRLYRAKADGRARVVAD